MRAALSHYIVGVVMGMADLVPGVSGGTIAFVSGRYERLVAAIHAVDLTALRLLATGRWRSLWQKLDLGLLLPLLAGVATAILSLAGVLDGWLGDPLARPRLFAFFIGLVAASAIIVGKRVGWRAGVVAAGMAGGVVGVAIAFVAPARTPQTAAWAVLAGGLAICAMILPGISGSFILLLTGQYERAVGAVHDRNLLTVALFAGGAVIGLLLFVRLLRWTLARHHDVTVGALVGFIVGALPRLWPWTACLDCVGFSPVAPAGGIGVAVGLAAVGGLGILGFERWARRFSGPVGS